MYVIVAFASSSKETNKGCQSRASCVVCVLSPGQRVSPKSFVVSLARHCTVSDGGGACKLRVVRARRCSVRQTCCSVLCSVRNVCPVARTLLLSPIGPGSQSIELFIIMFSLPCRWLLSGYWLGFCACCFSEQHITSRSATVQDGQF
jgi:hypothetical protein